MVRVNNIVKIEESDERNYYKKGCIHNNYVYIDAVYKTVEFL